MTHGDPRAPIAVSMTEMTRQHGRIVDAVTVHQETVIVTADSRPQMAILPATVYAALMRKAFPDHIQRWDDAYTKWQEKRKLAGYRALMAIISESGE